MSSQKILNVLALFSGVLSSTLILPLDSSLRNTQLAYSANLSQNSYPVIQQNGFVFQFKGCVATPKSDQALRCSLVIENKENRRELRLYSRDSKIIDGEGNEFFSTKCELGSDSGEHPKVDLPTQVPIKGSISFSKVPKGGIRILDLRFHSDGYFNLEIRPSQS